MALNKGAFFYCRCLRKKKEGGGAQKPGKYTAMSAGVSSIFIAPCSFRSLGAFGNRRLSTPKNERTVNR